MKKIIFSLIALICLTILPRFAVAEIINDFETKITINQDSSIIVEETIFYDFGAIQKHGIYRTIPFKYQARGGNYKLEIDVLSVKDLNGKNWPYTTKKTGNDFEIKIGDADQMVNAQKIYVISYRVGGALNYFQDHDELFWNITGNNWPVEIENSGAKIFLKTSEIKSSDFKTACYAGLLGSSDQSLCRLKKTEANTLSYVMMDKLSAGEGWSVVIGWPKGLVHQPTTIEKILKTAKDNLIILLPFIVFIGLYLYWRKYGKDPLGRGTIVPEYEPPQEMLPAEGGIIYDEKMDNQDIAATIIDLARRGYLKLKETDKKVLGFNTGKDWQLIKTEKANDLLGYEKNLFEKMFDQKNEISLSQLKTDKHLGNEIKLIKNIIYDSVVNKGWFIKNPEKARAKFAAIGFGVLAFLLFFMELIFESGFRAISIISIVISAILFIIFARFMPQKSKEGVLIKEKLLGFKMFLSVTEKDRASFHFSPSAQPEKFAAYLPWAIIFAVEKEWADVFKGVDLPAPDWYQGNWAGFYTAHVLSDSLSSFKNSFGSAVAGATAAKGASGFGGGGFSGGGFGGGGGGSW